MNTKTIIGTSTIKDNFLLGDSVVIIVDRTGMLSIEKTTPEHDEMIKRQNEITGKNKKKK